MRIVRQADVEQSLKALDISDGDAVLVHSDLMRFGRPENGIDTYLNAFDNVLEDMGTLSVPTFTFSFIQTGKYDCVETKSENMGIFAEAVRRHPHTVRTRHPIQSLALKGRLAADLVALDTSSAYSEDGTFSALCDMHFKLVLLGAEPKHISHSHLSEERARVPYRFEKCVSGTSILVPEEDATSGSWHFFARDLDLNVLPTGENKIVDQLLASGDWKSAELNGVTIFAGTASSFVAALDAKLKYDSLWMAPDRDELKKRMTDLDHRNA